MLCVESVRAEHAHDDRRQRISRRRRDHGESAERKHAAAARAQHDRGADEADRDRAPAAPADAFAEDRHRQCGDQQGGDKKQRIGLRQRQRLQAIGERRQHQYRQHAAQQMQGPAYAQQLARAAIEQGPGGDQRQRCQSAQRRDLHRRIVRRQRLHARIISENVATASSIDRMPGDGWWVLHSWSSDGILSSARADIAARRGLLRYQLAILPTRARCPTS